MNHRISLRIAMLCGAALTVSGCVSRNALDYLPAHIRAETAYAGLADRAGPTVIRIPQELREEARDEPSPPSPAQSPPQVPAEKPVPGMTLDRLLTERAADPFARAAPVAPPAEPPTLRLRSILPGDGTPASAGATGPRSDGAVVPPGARFVSFRAGTPPDPDGIRALTRLVGEERASTVVLTAGAGDPADFEALLAARRGMQAIAAALPADLRISQRFDPAVPAREIRAAAAH